MTLSGLVLLVRRGGREGGLATSTVDACVLVMCYNSVSVRGGV